MPFVTEQLWHQLPRAPADNNKAANALMLTDWPQMSDDEPLVTSDDAVDQFECFQELTRKIRNARAEYNVEPGKRISAVVIAAGDVRVSLENEIKSLVSLAKLDPAEVFVYEAGSAEAKKASEVESVQIVVRDGVEAYLPLSGLIDPEKERNRLEKQKEKLTREIQKLSGRLQSKGFIDKAPADVVAKAKTELAELEDQAAKVQSSLASLSQ
jgi:valyl-tRNA synthetase